MPPRPINAKSIRIRPIDGGFRATFDPPPDPVSGYEVAYREKGTQALHNYHSRGPVIRIVGLANGTMYEVRFRCRNGGGASLWTPDSTVMPTALPGS